MQVFNEIITYILLFGREEDEMNKDKLCLEIKEAEESQLSFLVTQFSPGNPMFQYNRYATQRGEGLYLIAWHHNTCWPFLTTLEWS